MRHPIDHPQPESDNDPGVLAAGLTGLVAGFLASFVDALVASQIGKSGWIPVEIARALAVFVPLGCLGGVLLGIAFRLLRRVHPLCRKAVQASLPVVWCFALFVYFAVHYYQGLAVSYVAYVRCAVLAVVLGIPSYAGLRRLWRRFGKSSALILMITAVSVGVCTALIEFFVVWKGLWIR